MTTQHGIYKCSVCGNIVDVLTQGVGTLICCGAPMTLLAENSTDAAQEKHVPVITCADGIVTVTVGSVAHPMTDEHYIEWIEVIADGASQRAFLKPGDEPKACFTVRSNDIIARAYCNLHELWKA